MKDVAAAQAFSNERGHAGPGSTISYLHEIEDALKLASQSARPAAWRMATGAGLLAAWLPDVSAGRVGERPPLSRCLPLDDKVGTSVALKFRRRLALYGHVLAGHKFASIAAALRTSERVVDDAVSEMAQTLIAQGLAPADSDADRLSRCNASQRMALWIRASHQPKHEAIVARIDHLASNDGVATLRLVWQDWLACRSGDYLALTNARSAQRLVQFMLDAGVQRGSLAIISDEGAASLPEAVARLGLAAHTPVQVRPGRAAHRLLFTEAGVAAHTAEAASVSVMGFHWLTLVLGSMLLARGEI